MSVATLKELRRQVRELRLEVDVLTRLVSKSRVDLGVAHLQEETEHPLFRVDLPQRAAAAVRALWADTVPKIVTLEDLSSYMRYEIASLEGVGRKSMSRIDDAMAAAGLSWAVA